MLVVFSGASGIGKSTVWLPGAYRLGYHSETPVTSRVPREGERPDIDYEYVTKVGFEECVRRRELVAWDYALENYYGYRVRLAARIKKGECIAIHALARIAIRLREECIPSQLLLLLATNEESLRERLRARGYTGRELAARIEHGMQEASCRRLFDHVVEAADQVEPDRVTTILEQLGIASSLGGQANEDGRFI